MDLSQFEPRRPAGLERPTPEAEALSKIARAVGGGSTTRAAGTFSAPQTYNADVNFTRAQQAGAARQARPQMQPLQFDAAQERVQRMQKAASQYAPGHEPDVTVHVEQQEARSERPPAPQPQPGTYRPQPMPGAPQAPQAPAPQAPAPQAPFPQPRARGQVFGRQPGDISSPYSTPVATSRPETVSTTPVRDHLGGQFEVPDLEADVPVQTYRTPQGVFTGIGEPGQVGNGWPHEREAEEERSDFLLDLPGERSGTGWPGTPQRSSSVSAMPARGSLGGQFGEPGAAETQQPATLGSMRDEIARRTSDHYATGSSVLDEMRPARRGVSDAIRAAGDLPEALA